jgi:hypothetical protein
MGAIFQTPSVDNGLVIEPCIRGNCNFSQIKSELQAEGLTTAQEVLGARRLRGHDFQEG